MSSCVNKASESSPATSLATVQVIQKTMECVPILTGSATSLIQMTSWRSLRRKSSRKWGNFPRQLSSLRSRTERWSTCRLFCQVNTISMECATLGIHLTPILRLQATFSGVLSAFFPKAHIVPAIKRHWLCRDPGYLEDFDNDPLTTNTQKIAARMGSETLRAMRALAMDTRVARPDSSFNQIPVLFLIGSADRVMCQRKGTRFFSRLASRDKEAKVFRGLYHCLLEDPEREDVLRHLMQWLEQRFPNRE